MAICLIRGHQYQAMRGAGQWRNSEFLVCQDCGKTVPIGQVAAPVLFEPQPESQVPARVHTQKPTPAVSVSTAGVAPTGLSGT